MERKVNRRQLVTLLGRVAGAGAAATLLVHAEVPAGNKPTFPMQKTPWPYQPLDPDVIAQEGIRLLP